MQPISATLFRRFVARLRCYVPIGKVTVKRVRDLRCHHQEIEGFVNKKRGRWIIEVRFDLSEDETIGTLIHEWAHALSGDMTHGPRWGVAYAKCYRAFYE